MLLYVSVLKTCSGIALFSVQEVCFAYVYFLDPIFNSLAKLRVCGGGAPVAPAAGGGTAVAASAKEEKKDEPTRENDEDLRFGFILP
ncbi:hypothetical protein YC2023_052041 [Brassica napus]